MKKKILLVEDDKVMADLLSLELEEAGFDTVYAKDGAKALEILSSQSFDGLLSDLFMPNMDGLQLIDAVTAMSINITIIIISGSINSSIDLLLKEKGVKHVFLKPLTDEQFNTLFSLLRSG
jgi:CheY-like chemotaxis protein